MEQMDVDVGGGATLGDPLVAPVPAFDAHDAARIAAAFGITGAASPSVSERDQNFRIAVEDGPGWVLKISNAAEDPSVVDMQARAMLHIARTAPELPVMRIGRALDGRSHAMLEDGESRSHIVRSATTMPRNAPRRSINPFVLLRPALIRIAESR